ncbi:MAG: zinc ABC transporter substrate-binding protein [Sphaerochaetaceae bacterium]
MKRIAFVVVLVLIILLSGCSRNSTETPRSSSRPKVTTTIGMIGDIALNLAGDYAEVTSLMGPGVDPHLYKATASDVKILSESDLILYGGLHLEGKMGDVLKSLSRTKKTVAVSESIPKENLIGLGDSYDPHVWFDINLWLYAVKAAYDSLVELIPERATEITENYNRYVEQLHALDEFIREEVAKLDAEQRVLITAHDAFEYFGKAYGFEVKGLQGISTVSEAGTRNVQDLANYIVEHQIKAVFIETSVPKKTIYSLQQAVKAKGFAVEIGGELFSDAMGDSGTKEGTYQGMLEHNITTIVAALAL